MDAAADYAEAVRRLNAPLPAYVSYKERSFAKAFSLSKDVTQTIVVRTQDGKVVKGNPDKIQISTDREVNVNPVSHPPFDATCYSPRSASPAQWSGRAVEAIALHGTCHKSAETQTDFQTLYVDPITHEPLAAVGVSDDDHVTVSLEERLARFEGHLLATGISVHIEGHGIAGFLDLTAGQEYAGYAFSSAMP